MLTSKIQKRTLLFKQASGTSRGVLQAKDSWIIRLSDDSKPGITGTGEASIIEGLSPEWNDRFEFKIHEICSDVDFHARNHFAYLADYPSVRFALESALLDLKHGGKEIYFPSEFTEGKKSISINGLIWMGTKEFMQQQIREKIEQGYRCLKLKIGAIDFESEIELLRSIRQEFTAADMELRVDANGAFSASEAPGKLNRLAKFDLHSIEQPIKPEQLESMRDLCASTPIPIALDEELIGVNDRDLKADLLSFISPQYIILKPSLIGGFKSCDEWIKLAEQQNIGWWITSALESNIGLNAIAQYTATKNNSLPQGLGTGQLFTNNFPSSLKIENGKLFLDF